MVAIIKHMTDISVICFSPVGQYTGLEPTITLSVWHPTRDYDPAGPVEGIYLLGNLVSLYHLNILSFWFFSETLVTFVF